MTVKSKDGKHDVCTICGAHLDYGEKCDCEREATHMKCECEKPDYAVDEDCPLDTGEIDHCEDCAWSKEIYD